MIQGTSPASSGPAGAHFKGQVGAFYLLSLLVKVQPLGLPGASIDRVAFQRAAEGHPLDDVIVHGHNAQGEAAVLEIQVKRSMTFAPSDPIFREVVGQIAKLVRKQEFWNTRHELAIAISRTSRKTEGAYHDVLTWARQLGDSTTFMNAINRPGSANSDMRAFIQTFKAHLQEAGTANDNETVWSLLRRLHILVFDYTASDSICEELAKDRAVRALHPEEVSRANDLWSVLTELAIKVSAVGGDRTREGLIQDLRERSFRFSEDRHNHSALMALAEASRNALADIDDHVGGAMLTRPDRVAQVRAALEVGRYVEIRGDAGVGKSGILKHFAEQISSQAQTIVLSPNRTMPRGWLEMRSKIVFDGSAHDLLSNLASTGGVILFVDSLDLYEQESRLTVIDLVREAATVPGMSVVVTARRDFGDAEPSWLPAQVIDQLGRTEAVVIDELSEMETEELRYAAPDLKALLSDNHPARPVARNLYRLSRLASLPSDAPAVHTEVEMARQWWDFADGKKDHSHRDRARVLTALAKQSIFRSGPLDVRELPSLVVDELAGSETLRDLGNDRVIFRHDVLRDWAIANVLFSDPPIIHELSLDRPAPASLARGVELAARMAIECSSDSVVWESFLDDVSKDGYHGSWRRAALLALVRGEIGEKLLNRASTHLLENDARVIRDLIRIVMAVDVEPGTKWFAKLGFDPKLIPAQTNAPNGASWTRLILWLLALGDSLSASAIPDVVDLYLAWSTALLGHDPLTPRIVRQMFRWLIEVENALDIRRPEGERSRFNGQLPHNQLSDLASNLRTGFLAFCSRAPELASLYLRSLRAREDGENSLRGILKFRGTLAQAVPKELAEITAELLIPQPEEDKEEDERRDPFREAFGYHDTDFIPASPSQGPFLELLIHAPEDGLTLIRQLIDHAIEFHTDGKDWGQNAIRIFFLDGREITFPWIQSYSWSRDVGAGPIIATCALMALEAWGHQRIEAGEPVEKVVEDIVGPPNPPAAYLLVVVDLLIYLIGRSRER